MPKRIHFIGIGGTGLSAIAKVMVQRGFLVSGSDMTESSFTQSLRVMGCEIAIGHAPENVQGADIIVKSSAIPESNVELIEANRRCIPIYRREEFFNQVLKEKTTIAVAGTHGKTTTTGMIAYMLDQLGMEPSYILGAEVGQLESNAKHGSSNLFVIEADEYDNAFLGIDSDIAVITNIEHDHVDCFPTEDSFLAAFQSFAKKIKPGGSLVGCGDDKATNNLMRFLDKDGTQTLSYGFGEMNDLIAIKQADQDANEGISYAIELKGYNIGRMSLQLPGNHNVLNALAAIGVAHLLDMNINKIINVLADFQGVSRRLEVIGEVRGITAIDDYAHHPTEITASLQAIYERYPEKEIWVVWQPHTYSRFNRFEKEFKSSFGGADHVIITGIYAAREPKPGDFDINQRIAFWGENNLHISDFYVIADYIVEHSLNNAVLVVFSAGDANQICELVLKRLN